MRDRDWRMMLTRRESYSSIPLSIKCIISLQLMIRQMVEGLLETKVEVEVELKSESEFDIESKKKGKAREDDTSTHLVSINRVAAAAANPAIRSLAVSYPPPREHITIQFGIKSPISASVVKYQSSSSSHSQPLGWRS